MIRMQNVEKSYPYKGGQTWVLRQINLEIRERDFVTIMGPSGSGKSTLLAILGMLDGDYTGEYFFDDKPLHKASVLQRPNRANPLLRVCVLPLSGDSRMPGAG